MIDQSFVNHPQYRLTNRILSGIAKVERSQGALDVSPLLPTYERELQSETIVSTIYSSTHIDGNLLGKSNVKKIIGGQPVTAKQRDMQEIFNYWQMLHYLDRVYSDPSRPFNDVMIREFHRVLMKDLLPGEQLGAYRQVQNYIVDAKSGKTVYIPPPAKNVPKLMLSAADWLSNVNRENCHPIIKAGLAHYLLEGIHPFIDGNGRVGRVTTMFLLYRDGYDTRKLFSIEEYYDQHIKDYYEVLQSVSLNRGDATVWLEYFVDGFAHQIEEVANKVKEYVHGEKERLKTSKPELNKRQYSGIRLLQKQGTLTASEYAKRFNISKRTANYDLADLVAKNMLIMEGESRSAHFKLP